MNEEDIKFGTIISIEDDLSANCDFSFVNNEIKKSLFEAFKSIDAVKLKGWRLNIIIVYKRAQNIYFGKRGMSVPSNKTKEFFLRLAVPTLEQASYGFNKKKFEYDDPIAKIFFVVSPNFENYETLESYLIDSAKRTIYEVLKNGITFNGEKLKL